jgi:hypothetical protein
MRVRTLWVACLLAAGLALAPRAAYAQTEDGADGALPDPIFPFPLYHNHPAKGGLFTYAEFVMWRQTNPLNHQPIAYQGFFDVQGLLSGTPGQFIGSGNLVLDAKDAGGPGSYQPGLVGGIGYRFENGVTFSAEWLYLYEAKYFRDANIIPPAFVGLGAQLENTFLTAPVYNFSNFYAGPPLKSLTIPVGDAYGIWNGASEMIISFRQRTQQIQGIFRIPIHETECWRTYGLIGPRFFWIWERFRWLTTSEDPDGNFNPATDQAIYNNVVSNRMYGIHIGMGNEWYLGKGVAVALDTEGAIFLDSVKQEAKYELGVKDQPGQVKRTVVTYTVVPEVQANLNLCWYPIEGVQLQLGYDLMAFFNTVAASHPVSFDVGGLDPPWGRVSRVFDGWHAGIAFIW